MQNFYNACYREEEREMIPTLKVCTLASLSRGTIAHHTLSIDVWRRLHPMVPFGSGFPYSSLERCVFHSSKFWRVSDFCAILDFHLTFLHFFYSYFKTVGFASPEESKKRVNEGVQKVADNRGISMAQVALAWNLSRDFITAPIVGTTSLDKLKDLLGMFLERSTWQNKKETVKKEL